MPSVKTDSAVPNGTTEADRALTEKERERLRSVFASSYVAYNPVGATVPIFPTTATNEELRAEISNCSPSEAPFNPSTLFCSHVPLAASEGWRQRLIPEYQEGGVWVCPRLTVRPSGKNGRMLLTTQAKDLESSHALYEGIAELVVPHKSNQRKMLFEPKRTVASHLFEEHRPTLEESFPMEKKRGPITSSISSVRSFKNWVSNHSTDLAIPFNIRHFEIDPETGFVQNVVITGDSDDDALIITRMRRALFEEGIAEKILHDVVKACRGRINLDPGILDYSIVEEELVKTASATGNQEVLSKDVQAEWQAQRASITEGFRRNMRNSLRQSFLEPAIAATVMV